MFLLPFPQDVESLYVTYLPAMFDALQKQSKNICILDSSDE